MSLVTIERAIVSGIRGAFDNYLKMSGGYFLWHAPEYYITVEVARSLADKKYRVYFDVPVGRIGKLDFGDGRISNSKSCLKRVDVSIFSKTDNSMRALLEIKKTNNFTNVESDFNKLKKISRLKSSPDIFYQLIYSDDSNKRETYINRHKRWSDDLGMILVKDDVVPVRSDRDDQDFYWGFCLLRYQKSA